MARHMSEWKRMEKLIDARINAAYMATCTGIAINILDISKIFQHGRRQIAMHDVDDAALAISIREYVETIRQN